MSIQETFERLAARYAAGALPWDQERPPPEVEALAATLAPGRALDLGCGFARAAILLARNGWEVDAVDFVPQAVAEARARVEAAGLADRVRLHEAAVPALGFLGGPYDLALDVGCGHSFVAADLARYRDELARLLAPGGLFALFCRLRRPEDPERPAQGPRGLDEALLRATFAAGFRLERVAYGESSSGAGPGWPSAWLWFRREGDAPPGAAGGRAGEG